MSAALRTAVGVTQEEPAVLHRHGVLGAAIGQTTEALSLV